MAREITTVTVSTMSATGRPLYAISFIDLDNNHYLLTGFKSTTTARKALIQYITDNLPGSNRPEVIKAIQGLKPEKSRLGTTMAIGFGLYERGEVGALKDFATFLINDAACAGKPIEVVDYSAEDSQGEYAIKFYSPAKPKPVAEVAPDVEDVAPAPVEETNAAADHPAESTRLDSGEGLNAKDRATRLTPQITAPGVYRLSHVVEINPLRLIVEDNAIYWGYEAAGEINPVQGLQAFEIAGDMTAALTKALKKFKAANASAKELAGWKTYA